MKFTPNKPEERREADVTVDAGLAPGVYRFRLEVIGAQTGRKSKPMEVVVRIEGRVPIPVPGPIPIPGPVIPGPIIIR